MPLIETTGSASAKALGLNSASGPVNYIEDVFSTYLYTGNDTARSISNGIDISTKGGLVWVKQRQNHPSWGNTSHILSDTARGANKQLLTNSTNGESSVTTQITAFNSDGFSLGTNSEVNASPSGGSGGTYVSWTFRKQPKFFDVVTYTGNGGSNRAVSHSLGSVPGMIIVKRTNTTDDWWVYHRSLGRTKLLWLNTTNSTADLGTANYWGTQDPDSSNFYVGNFSGVNTNGATYVAYLFAHDAGGFGTAGTDNVISCGSFTTNGSGLASVNLGYEPQWVLFKASSTSSNWYILDNMRGLDAVKDQGNALAPNLSNAEFTFDPLLINATGFNVDTAPNPNTTYIYIAIRRGPMKTPTSGTSVFSNLARTGSGTNPVITGLTSPVDMVISQDRGGSSTNFAFDRLRGNSNWLTPSGTNAEGGTATLRLNFDVQDGYSLGSSSVNPNQSGRNYIFWNFKRAPGFMDVVCYTGTGSTRTVSHNLGVAPELMIVKTRNSADNDWAVYAAPLGATKHLRLNATIAEQTGSNRWGSTSPTASVFTVGDANETNWNTYNFVAYLFASCPGVSKVGSYTGTGGTQTISCGFAARFVLIKRTDSTGNWWVWDTARGMVAGTDPRLAFNVTDAESNANWVYTDASGFQIVTTDATVNASGGSYIFLAVG